MSDARVLITDTETPIYHNSNPTCSTDIQVQTRWKGKCLEEFYETVNTPNGEFLKQELVRSVLVWNTQNKSPTIFMDGVWTNYGYNRDALIIPGTSAEIRDEFDDWLANRKDRSIEIKPKIGSVEDAKRDMGEIFSKYFAEIQLNDSPSEATS